MSITYDISKQRGTQRWYAHRVETPKIPESPLCDKKGALHAAADLMSITYKEYMELRRRKN